MFEVAIPSPWVLAVRWPPLWSSPRGLALERLLTCRAVDLPSVRAVMVTAEHFYVQFAAAWARAGLADEAGGTGAVLEPVNAGLALAPAAGATADNPHVTIFSGQTQDNKTAEFSALQARGGPWCWSACHHSA